MKKPMSHKQKPIYAPVPDKPGVPNITAHPGMDKEAVRSGTAKTPKTIGSRTA